MALLISASVSVAARCADDPNECTLKKLCEVATTVDSGNTIWSTASGSSKHVTVAQSLGMECGITPIVDLCDTDPSECKLSQMCGKATTDNAGQVSWDDSAIGYVALAKEYGLSCEVVAKAAVVKNECSTKSAAGCTAEELCNRSVHFVNGERAWDTSSLVWQAHVAEAKKRGLTCGVVAIVDPCDLKNKLACNDPHMLCRFATFKGEWETQSYLIPYVKEAQKRGLTCGVKAETTSANQSADLKKVFNVLSVLERKQMQYALKKLGYYQSTVDGIWGGKTNAALSSFIRSERIKSRNALFNLTEMVNVPSSFAAPQAIVVAPKRTTTDTAGLSAIISNPSVTGRQALAVCKPRALLRAEETARRVKGYNCEGNTCSQNSGEQFAGLIPLLLKTDPASRAERASKETYDLVMDACLAQYGWRD